MVHVIWKLSVNLAGMYTLSSALYSFTLISTSAAVLLSSTHNTSHLSCSGLCHLFIISVRSRVLCNNPSQPPPLLSLATASFRYASLFPQPAKCLWRWRNVTIPNRKEKHTCIYGSISQRSYLSTLNAKQSCYVMSQCVVGTWKTMRTSILLFSQLYGSGFPRILLWDFFYLAVDNNLSILESEEEFRPRALLSHLKAHISATRVFIFFNIFCHFEDKVNKFHFTKNYWFYLVSLLPPSVPKVSYWGYWSLTNH